jgi:hypothetical protein
MKTAHLVPKQRRGENLPGDRSSCARKESLLGQATVISTKSDPSYGCVEWFAYAVAERGDLTRSARDLG